MGYTALLTVELKADDKQLIKFNGEMKKKGWDKISDMTTAWSCEFDDDASLEDARETTEDDVGEATEKAGIKEYYAAANFSEEDVELFYDD